MKSRGLLQKEVGEIPFGPHQRMKPHSISDPQPQKLATIFTNGHRVFIPQKLHCYLQPKIVALTRKEIGHFRRIMRTCNVYQVILLTSLIFICSWETHLIMQRTKRAERKYA